MILLGWFILGTAFVACGVILLVLMRVLHSPDTRAWCVVLLASAALPGIAFLFLEGRIDAGPRYARQDPASQEPALLLGNNPQLPPPSQGLLLQHNRCSLHTSHNCASHDSCWEVNPGQQLSCHHYLVTFLQYR